MSFNAVNQSNDAVVVDTKTLSQLKSNNLILEESIYWHKIIIEDVYGMKRNVVLKIIFDSISPLDLIPLCYTGVGRGAFFFVRACRQAIVKFCMDNLRVQNPFCKDKPFKLTIILKYTTTNVVKVDLSENVLSVLQKRFKPPVLDLNNFCEDRDLTEFFSLSQPKLLAFVLNAAKMLKPMAVKLWNNGIQTLDAFRIMPDKSIISLDLRHNLIKDLVELKHLEHFDITELWLEDNPLCDFYDEYSYRQQIIKYCPKIEKIDGFLLRQNGVPSFRRNFLCSTSSYKVVNHFLERYFPAYDAKLLAELTNFYHDNAMFSMSSNFYQFLSSPTAPLQSYKVHSRNLLNGSSGNTNLYYGSTSIIKLFNILPYSEHDPYSFTIDVLYFSEKSAIVVVTGVFREVPKIERIFGFNRYFVLERRDEDYKIANEQMHIFNALSSQQLSAFKKPLALHEAENPTQKVQMIDALAVITNLTKDWAKLFLEDCHYNLKHAVVLFIDLYKSDKIPSNSFTTVD